MACPALPLCGLAITEAERGLPDINRCAAVVLVFEWMYVHSGVCALNRLLFRVWVCLLLMLALRAMCCSFVLR
jgi:hypothetical protein